MMRDFFNSFGPPSSLSIDPSYGIIFLTSSKNLLDIPQMPNRRHLTSDPSSPFPFSETSLSAGFPFDFGRRLGQAPALLFFLDWFAEDVGLALLIPGFHPSCISLFTLCRIG